MVCVLFRTLETVAGETPARRATSLMVWPMAPRDRSVRLVAPGEAQRKASGFGNRRSQPVEAITVWRGRPWRATRWSYKTLEGKLLHANGGKNLTTAWGID